jgi:hypothetical protein
MPTREKPAPKIVGSPKTIWKTKDGKTIVGANVPVGDGSGRENSPRGTKEGAEEYRRWTYSDGYERTFKYNPQTGQWDMVGAPVMPDDPSARTRNDEFEKDVKAWEAEQVKAKEQERPKLLGEATQGGQWRTIQHQDPETGEIKLEKIEDPSWKSNQESEAAKSKPRDDAAIAASQASVEASRASAASSAASTKRTEAETRKLESDEAQRKAQGGYSTSELIQKRQQEWQEYTDKVKQDFDNRKITFEEAKAKLDAEHNRLTLQTQQDSQKITQRGQDIQARGQSLDFASEMGRIGLGMMPYMSDPGAQADIDASIAGMANPRAPVQHVPSTGRLPDKYNPKAWVNAAIAAVNPGATGAPNGGFITAPSVPGQVQLTGLPAFDPASAPRFGPAAAPVPPPPPQMPPPMVGAAAPAGVPAGVTAPPAMNEQDALRWRLAQGYPT